jgi:hypothetical protein
VETLAKRLDGVEADDVLETVHSKEAGYFKREEYLTTTSIMSSLRLAPIDTFWVLYLSLAFLDVSDLF